VNRKDIEQNSVCIARGNAFGKPDLSQIRVGGQTLVIKDVGKKNLLFRWTLGLWLIHKEWEVYLRLKGMRGVPKAVERIDRFAFALEFVAGRTIERGDTLRPSFFSDLERMIEEIHSRRVVHLDLRHKGNILISNEGSPVLIDFNSGFCFKDRGLLLRFLFPILKWVDEGGLLKLKQRVAPSLMSPEELSSLNRFTRMRKLWIFN
jgi:serine/threonine protein kinase